MTLVRLKFNDSSNRINLVALFIIGLFLEFFNDKGDLHKLRCKLLCKK